jgi:hypothetical protein
MRRTGQDRPIPDPAGGSREGATVRAIVAGAVFLAALLLAVSAPSAAGQETAAGKVDWVEGYVSATGEGTAAPGQDRVKDRMKAIRAATVMGQRALLETIQGVKIDSSTRVEKKMLQEDAIHSRIEGTIRGAEIVRQDVRWEGDRPVATVELRVCLAESGACKSGKSLVVALDLDRKAEQSDAPRQRLNDIEPRQGNIAEKVPEVVYDSSRPVTGIILNLQGLRFERVILPVVITVGKESSPITVYSVKNVEPQVIRSYGVVRYADSVDQARNNPDLGDNPIIVSVSGVTKENLIQIDFDAARVIRETTLYGNDYLKSAKVVIAAK